MCHECRAKPQVHPQAFLGQMSTIYECRDLERLLQADAARHPAKGIASLIVDAKERVWALWNERAAQLESEMFRAMKCLSTSTRPRWNDEGGGICFHKETTHASNWQAQLQKSTYAKLLEPSARTLGVLHSVTAAPAAVVSAEEDVVSLLALPGDILSLIMWSKLEPAASLACAATCTLLKGLLEGLLGGPLRLSVFSAPSSTHLVWPLRWHTWQSQYSVISADWSTKGACSLHAASGGVDLTDQDQLQHFFDRDHWGGNHPPGIFATTLRRYWDACAALLTQDCVHRRQQLNHWVDEFDRLEEQLDILEDTNSTDSTDYGWMRPGLWLAVLIYLAPMLSDHGPLCSGPGVIVSIGRVITTETAAYIGDHEGFGHPEVILVMRLESGRVLAVHFPRMRCGMYGCCDECVVSSSPRPVQCYSAASFEELCRHLNLSHISVQWVVSK